MMMKWATIVMVAAGVSTGGIAVRGLPQLLNPTGSDLSDRRTSSPRQWEWKGRIEPDGSVEIKAVNGSITVEGIAGQEAEVTAEIRGVEEDSREIEIVVREHGPDLTICAVHPGVRDRADTPDEVCQPGPHGLPQSRARDVQVNFTVRLPALTRFVGRTVNGDIRAEGTRARTEAYTVNGDVSISTTGLAQVGIVNGSIHASLGRGRWEGTLSFTTVNGSVIIELPPELAAEVNVSTVAGHVSIEFPVTVSGRFSPRHVKGTVGDGGGVLVVKSVQGNVEVRRR